jgi:hypothetical protein
MAFAIWAGTVAFAMVTLFVYPTLPLPKRAGASIIARCASISARKSASARRRLSRCQIPAGARARVAAPEA